MPKEKSLITNKDALLYIFINKYIELMSKFNTETGYKFKIIDFDSLEQILLTKQKSNLFIATYFDKYEKEEEGKDKYVTLYNGDLEKFEISLSWFREILKEDSKVSSEKTIINIKSFVPDDFGQTLRIMSSIGVSEVSNNQIMRYIKWDKKQTKTGA